MKVKVPGKLLVAGEYAVLEKNQVAVVTAVSRYVTVTVTPSDQFYLQLPSLGIRDVTWTYKNNQIHTSIDDPKLKFIKAAIFAVYNYLDETAQLPKEPFTLLVESELDEETSGKKFGLGSSAAVVVGIVKALFQMAGDFSKETVFKAAAVAHFMAQGSGSGADVAASTFGGIIRYTSFHPQWMAEQLKSGVKLKALIDHRWPYFSWSRLELPSDASFCVGWTRSPVGTAPLIRKMDDFKEKNPSVFQSFLQETAEAVSTFIDGVQEKNTDLTIKGIKLNRAALVRLGKEANIPIETQALKQLADIAEAYGGAGKPSGAGGGDCGIALVKGREQIDLLQAAWRNADILPLPLLDQKK